MSRRTLVVLGTDVLIRGFQSVPTDVVDPDGAPTNALLGAVRTVRRALSFKDPDRAVAVLAPELPSGLPPTLRAQAPRLPAVLEAHGLHVVRAERPLDAAAAMVRTAVHAGDDVVVAGSDKRLGQLVDDRVWWYEGHKDVRYTPDAVRKKFGVPPDQLADWLALVGEEDITDGVKGIGRKGAIGLLEAHGSLDAALAEPEAVQGRAGNALRTALDQAREQQALATLGRDGRCPIDLDDARWQAPEPDALNALYRQLGFFQLLSAAGARAPLSYAVCDRSEAVAEAIARFGDDPVAVFALTEDPSPVRGALVGLALAPASGTAVYVPLRGRDALDEVPASLVAWLQDPHRPKTGHDTKAVVVALAGIGVQLRGVVGDAAIASHLADPSAMAPHDLDRIARAVLHRPVQPPERVRGRGSKQKAWADLPVDRSGGFACQRADTAGDLWRALAPEEADQQALLDEALALCDTLVRMELRGMPCDADDLATVGDDFAAINDELQERIFALAGHAFTINSTKQLGTVLFEELGLPVISRTKTGYSTAAHVLDRLAGAHEIVPLVSRWRQLRRLQDTWVNALIDAIDDDGRVRSTFHPARSFSGRLVNSQPDLGRVPGRTPELARIRRAFRAPEGRVLLSVDYDQLGLYVLAHLTGDPALVEPLRRGDDMHVATASAVLERDPADIDDAARQVGKVVNFATFAGQGSSALAQQLGVEPAEARAMIQRFFARYAVTRQWLDDQLAFAREHGWVPTLAGRRWRIRQLQSLEPRDLAYGERLAKRGGPEGSVADVTRRGLLHADRALREAGRSAAPLVQIHDEVVFEVLEGELDDAARIASEAMVGAFTLTVPLQVSCKAGPTWADLRPL